MTLEPLHEVCFRLGDRVCPLYTLDDASRGFLIGTAIPVSYKGQSFLVTAAHVLSHVTSRPLITFGARETIVIGGNITTYSYTGGTTIDADVAVIWLTDVQANDIGSEFVFTYAEDFGTVGEYDKLRLYALLGYPHSKHRPKPRSVARLRATPTYLVLREFSDLASLRVEGTHERVHFSLSAPDGRAIDYLGQSITVPKMQGASGGGVWRLDIDPQTGAMSDPVLVGFGILHDRRHSGAFLVTRAEVIMPLIKQRAGS